MARQYRKAKPLIYVFCEGESEVAYVKFLKELFRDAAIFRTPKTPSSKIFEEADDKFRKDTKCKDDIEIIDEIWFFFDVEVDEHNKWDARYKIIKRLQKLRRKPNIRVRLLMTSACVEYWFLLHYKMLTPSLVTVPDKQRMLNLLKEKVPEYRKGDENAIKKIGAQYQIALKNGERTILNLRGEGLPTVEDTIERNEWLYKSSKTFTTVQEAIRYLEGLNP